MNYANFLKLCSLLLLSLMLTNTYAGAQSPSHTYPGTTLAERPKNVKTKIMGTVVDNRGEPIIGASIMVKGSDKGVPVLPVLS